VRENVRFGREGASERDVDTAFEELGLGGWVESLPEGLDTIVGERGEAVSVGERQLVALARAQIASPGLLILDEATSAVDPGTERRITEAIRRLSEGRTVVTIAHRMSTAEVADHVFVFDAGRLVEEGTHEELVTAGGVYGRLHDSWLGNGASARDRPPRRRLAHPEPDLVDFASPLARPALERLGEATWKEALDWLYGVASSARCPSTRIPPRASATSRRAAGGPRPPPLSRPRAPRSSPSSASASRRTRTTPSTSDRSATSRRRPCRPRSSARC